MSLISILFPRSPLCAKHSGEAHRSSVLPFALSLLLFLLLPLYPCPPPSSSSPIHLGMENEGVYKSVLSSHWAEVSLARGAVTGGMASGRGVARPVFRVLPQVQVLRVGKPGLIPDLPVCSVGQPCLVPRFIQGFPERRGRVQLTYSVPRLNKVAECQQCATGDFISPKKA